jgi:hypothetical protein
MAQKLSVQIELEGAAEIARQLENLGETGKKAFQELGAAAEKVGGFDQLDPTEVTKKLEDMGITGVDAINQIQDAVQQAGDLEGMVQGVQGLEKAFGALGKVVRPLGGEIRKIQGAVTSVYAALGPFGVAGVAAVAGISTAVTLATKATIGFADSINKVNDQAIKLGVGVGPLDKFRAGLEQAGVSAKSVAEILQSKLATEQGVKGLQAFISELQKLPDNAARSKYAIDTVGDAGAELIRILQAGGRLSGFGPSGGLISDEDAQKATQLGQAINQLESAWNRFNSVQAAPVIIAGVNAATAAVEVLGQRMSSLPGVASLAAQGLVTPFQTAAQLIVAAIGEIIFKVKETGPVVQETSPIFTQWGTLVKQQADQATVSFTTLGTTVTQTGDKAKQAGETAASGWDVLLKKLKEYLGLVGQQAVTGAQIGIGGMAGGGLLGGRGTGTSDSNLAWLSRGEYIMPASAVARPGVLSFLEALRRTGRIPGFAQGGLIPAFAGGGTVPADQLRDFLDQVTSQLDRALGALTNDLINSILRISKDVEQPMHALLDLMGKIKGRAAGGLLGGRGTGTSDSNLAWVSRGEHIMPARAVRQPGVLAFLEALRHSGGDLGRILDGMGRFALGGLVGQIPAYAAGGLAGGSSNVTIQFPGLPAIGGLRASSSVVNELRQAAALAQVRSGGRKPSRYS